MPAVAVSFFALADLSARFGEFTILLLLVHATVLYLCGVECVFDFLAPPPASRAALYSLMAP